ncbi:hypothetical protein K2Z84_13830 [Candidatus Binatia bacterium]|nr:hypothetical protein [Candidatus Binatia bacterium]
MVEAETGGLIEPSVDVTVSSRGDVLKYVYTFTSASGSEQSIQAISIDLSSGGPVLDGTDESGWALGRVGRQAQDSSDARATWLPIGSTPLLAPEAAARGLTISSKDWPALTDAIFLSHPSRAFVPEATAELPERVERFLLDRDRLDSDVRRVTVGPRIAPPARTAEGRRAVVRHLMADAGKAEAAGLADVAAAALIRGILEQAEANVESPQAFADLAGKIDGAVGASPTYRQSVSWVLRALGSPSDAPPDGGRRG